MSQRLAEEDRRMDQAQRKEADERRRMLERMAADEREMKNDEKSMNMRFNKSSGK